MTNPWLKKNPFMSMWVSSANAAFGATRGQVAALQGLQSSALARQAAQDVFDLWLNAIPRPASQRRQRRR